MKRRTQTCAASVERSSCKAAQLENKLKVWPRPFFY